MSEKKKKPGKKTCRQEKEKEKRRKEKDSRKTPLRDSAGCVIYVEMLWTSCCLTSNTPITHSFTSPPLHSTMGTSLPHSRTL